MKTCSKCKVEKDEGEFYKHERCKGGLHCLCKSCISELRKKYRSENKEKISEIRKKYYSKNKEKISAIKKKYILANKEKKVKYDKIYYSKNKEKFSEHNKKYHLENKEKFIEYKKKYMETDLGKKYAIKRDFKRYHGFAPPAEIVEVKLIINKTKQLCKTLKN